MLDKTLDMLELQLGDAQVKLVKDYAPDLPAVSHTKLADAP